MINCECSRIRIKKMFELATDFSKRTVYPKFLDINPNWDYEESQKQATRYIKSLICRNIEIPNDEPKVRNNGLEWKINPTVIKYLLYIINNIDVRHWGIYRIYIITSYRSLFLG